MGLDGLEAREGWRVEDDGGGTAVPGGRAALPVTAGVNASRRATGRCRT